MFSMAVFDCKVISLILHLSSHVANNKLSDNVARAIQHWKNKQINKRRLSIKSESFQNLNISKAERKNCKHNCHLHNTWQSRTQNVHVCDVTKLMVYNRENLFFFVLCNQSVKKNDFSKRIQTSHKCIWVAWTGTSINYFDLRNFHISFFSLLKDKFFEFTFF